MGRGGATKLPLYIGTDTLADIDEARTPTDRGESGLYVNQRGYQQDDVANKDVGVLDLPRNLAADRQMDGTTAGRKG